VGVLDPGSGGAGTAEAILDLESLEARLPELRARYAQAEPFPHIVLDDFLIESVADRATREFPSVDPEHWINWVHVNERKYGNRDESTWGPTLRQVASELMSPRFVDFLGALTSVEGLLIDPSFEGGGLHESRAGGFLNVHADFTVHPHHRQWRRRVNVLLYLNGEWPSEYGGEFELWSPDMKRCVERVAPIGNRVVIFNTDKDSFHGHPERLRCPEGAGRRSLALYYFTEEAAPYVRSTEYRSRPGDGPRSVLIYLDKQALRTYDRVKRRLGLADDGASKMLRRIERLRFRKKKS
jgi:hypothetical protein